MCRLREASQICKHIVEPINPFQEDVEEGISVGIFLSIIGIICVAVLGVMLLYKRSMNKHMRTMLRQEVIFEVNQQMDAYKRMR